jgi:hypothetical protein
MGDDVAHLLGRARGGIQVAGALDQSVQLGVQCLKLVDAPADLLLVGRHQRGDVGARHDALLAEVDDFAQLGEREPDRLAGLDEGDPVAGVVVVLPVAGSRPGRPWQQSPRS